jgi:hypothetical protein
MSEPIKIADTNGYVSSGSVPSRPIDIQFKDGVRTISEAIVSHLGGTDVVLHNAKVFKNNTYDEFMKGFWHLVEKDRLNSLGASFIQGHIQTFGFTR